MTYVSPASAQQAEAAPPLLELTGISKHYGGVRALHNVNLRLDRGEVVALVGDNGAGKTTLVKIISGVERPDEGQIVLSGDHIRMESIRSAAQHGIRTVYQDLSLCDNLDTVENLFLGQERTLGPWSLRKIQRREMEEKAAEVLDGLSVKIRSLRVPVGGLSGGQRQGIAICRALISQPSLVILDEPTAALGVSQRNEVLELITRLRAQNHSVLVISHDMKDVQQVADRVAVMRLGTKVTEFQRDHYSSSDLVAAMTGALEVNEDA